MITFVSLLFLFHCSFLYYRLSNHFSVFDYDIVIIVLFHFRKKQEVRINMSLFVTTDFGSFQFNKRLNLKLPVADLSRRFSLEP